MSADVFRVYCRNQTYRIGNNKIVVKVETDEFDPKPNTAFDSLVHELIKKHYYEETSKFNLKMLVAEIGALPSVFAVKVCHTKNGCGATFYPNRKSS